MLLNLRTSQPFEEVLEDLGQVLKMNGAKRMYTAGGQEVRSFSQLRNEFADIDTFYLGTSAAIMIPPPIMTGGPGSPVRRSRSRAGLAASGPAMGAAVGSGSMGMGLDELGGGGGGVVGGGGGIGIGAVSGTKASAARQRARSKSRPRVLYAPESEIVRQGTGKFPTNRLTQ